MSSFIFSKKKKERKKKRMSPATVVISTLKHKRSATKKQAYGGNGRVHRSTCSGRTSSIQLSYLTKVLGNLNSLQYLS